MVELLAGRPGSHPGRCLLRADCKQQHIQMRMIFCAFVFFSCILEKVDLYFPGFYKRVLEEGGCHRQIGAEDCSERLVEHLDHHHQADIF